MSSVAPQVINIEVFVVLRTRLDEAVSRIAGDPANEDKYISELLVASRGKIMCSGSIEHLLQLGQAKLAAKFISVVDRESRDDDLHVLFRTGDSEVNTPAGAEFLEEILPNFKVLYDEWGSCMFHDFLKRHLLYPLVTIVKDNPSNAHTVCRAAVVSACEYRGCRDVWTPLRLLARALPDQRLDLRGIDPDLACAFGRCASADDPQNSQPGADFFMSHVFGEVYGSSDRIDGGVAGVSDLLVRLTELFRSVGVRVVVNELQRAWRAARYHVLCLVAAAMLKRLGHPTVRVSFVARDLVAGWL